MEIFRGLTNRYSALSWLDDAVSRAIYCLNWQPPTQPLLLWDIAAANETTQEEVMNWIHAVSENIKYSKKVKRDFMKEWRSQLWDLEGYLAHPKSEIAVRLPENR